MKNLKLAAAMFLLAVLCLRLSLPCAQAQADAPKLRVPAGPQATAPQSAAAPDAGPLDAPLPEHAGPVPPGLADYTGMLDGNQPVHVTTVAKSDGTVTGSYFLLSDLRRLPFTGRAIDATSFSAKVDVAASDAKASPYLYLKVDKSGNDRLSGALYGDKGDTARQHSIAVALISASAGVTSENDRYSVAGAKDPAVVEANAAAFLQAVEAGQPEKAATLINFPLAYTANGRRTLLHTPADFIARFPSIFSANYLATLRTVPPRAMFATSQGIMLGDGQVWFNAEGKAFALNNQPVRMFTRKRFLSNAGWARAASQSQQPGSKTK